MRLQLFEKHAHISKCTHMHLNMQMHMHMHMHMHMLQ